MSAFLVERETLDRITQGLMLGTLNEDYEPRCCPTPRELYGTGNLQCSDNRARKALGEALWSMNLRALHARYGTAEVRWESEEVAHGYTPAVPPDGSTTLPQFVKSLDCLLYQCSEGAVPEESLYRELERYRDQVNARIVAGLPEYDEATWG